jgi:hypothetical protein
MVKKKELEPELLTWLFMYCLGSSMFVVLGQEVPITTMVLQEQFIVPPSFREDFKNFSQSETRIANRNE